MKPLRKEALDAFVDLMCKEAMMFSKIRQTLQGAQSVAAPAAGMARGAPLASHTTGYAAHAAPALPEAAQAGTRLQLGAGMLADKMTRGRQEAFNTVSDLTAAGAGKAISSIANRTRNLGSRVRAAPGQAGPVAQARNLAADKLDDVSAGLTSGSLWMPRSVEEELAYHTLNAGRPGLAASTAAAAGGDASLLASYAARNLAIPAVESAAGSIGRAIGNPSTRLGSLVEKARELTPAGRTTNYLNRAESGLMSPEQTRAFLNRSLS